MYSIMNHILLYYFMYGLLYHVMLFFKNFVLGDAYFFKNCIPRLRIITPLSPSLSLSLPLSVVCQNDLQYYHIKIFFLNEEEK